MFTFVQISLMAQHNILGKEGEKQATAFLTARHYTILHTNWRYRRNELDIVAAKDGELVIVEVKTRSADCLMPPEEAVDGNKIRRMVAAAEAYIHQFNIDMPVRFDIISIIKHNGGYEVEHIDNAFYAPRW